MRIFWKKIKRHTYRIKGKTHTKSMSLSVKNVVREILYTAIGSLLMAFATAQFLLPNHLSTGGFSGIATIFFYLFQFPMGTMNVLLNIPFLLWSCFKVGRYFIVKALSGTFLLSLFLNLLENLPALTQDKFLACLYGGIVMGFGSALVFKANSSTGGTDLITTFVRQYKPQIRTSQIIILFDTIIVILNMIFFRKIEVGLYSAIAIYIMGKVIDISFEGINFAKMIVIVSNHYEAISDQINQNLCRGTTGLYGKGMYTNHKKMILICVANRNEVTKIRSIVASCDPHAFLIITNAREVFGKGFKKENFLK